MTHSPMTRIPVAQQTKQKTPPYGPRTASRYSCLKRYVLAAGPTAKMHAHQPLSQHRHCHPAHSAFRYGKMTTQRRPFVARMSCARSRTSTHVAPTRQEPSDLQPVSFAAALVAAAALVISPMGAPAFAAPAAGELSSGVGQVKEINMGDSKSTAADAQPSVDPGWGMPFPIPHPPASPPQTPSPEGPPKPSLSPGPPDLLPHKPPAPGPQLSPKPDLPQLPDVPPQHLPPCPPNLAPPQLLPPCPQPQVPPPIRPTQQGGFDGQVVGRGSSSKAAWLGAGPVYDGGALTSSMGVAAAHVTDTALVPNTHSPDAAAAIDAALNPTGDVPAAPSTLERPQDVKAGSELDSGTMSVNLDGRLPAAGPSKAATGSAAPAARAASGSSSPALSFAGRGGASGSDWQPGSLTVGQVLSVTGQLALQLLELLVRGAAFVIKYTLKAFIWLVKLIGQAAGV